MGSTGHAVRPQRGVRDHLPRSGLDTELARNRHGDRLGAAHARSAGRSAASCFTRAQSDSAAVPRRHAASPAIAKDANCDYKKAPFFNVLAAFWIQFMTHDWFSHLEEGHNAPEYDGGRVCRRSRSNGVDAPLTPADAARLGCRPGDRIDRAFVADSTPGPHVHRRRGRSTELARLPDHRNTEHRLVGRLADLRLRRALAPCA